ncbi:MAG TPA: hypothetical protein VML55_02490 [Planctomycetaceae bacterium]|nr:hypothetical protein [Planctomycetaceae bacterium]
MAERPLGQLTLSEKFVDAERMARELMDHLDRGFLPRIRELQKLVEPADGQPLNDEVEDLTVRIHAARVLESDLFTEELYARLERYCRSINADVSRILTGG